MAVLGGGGDQKHKLAAGGDHSSRQKPAANGSFEAFEVEAFDWPASSPSSSSSSTRQMLGNNNGDRHQQQHRNTWSSSGRRLPFVKKMDWGSLWGKSKEWIRNPLNMALLVWIVAVGVSGAILFMVMTGMLNRALPKKSQRDTWFEVNNQILNALFTLMCLYQHPRRFYHLALLWRWRAGDMLQLRQAYCKDGTCKPDERSHMAVVILLLHLNCFAQYALCGLNLGYQRPKRPPVGVGLTISVAICAPAVAGLYNNLSPLGKDYEAQPQADEESPPVQLQRKTLEKRYSFAPRQGGQPHQWVGGLFDLWDDISVAYLSVFCSCCVFGWNMSRLGFGNMYVHIVTFVLFCLAPFFIFNLAAINIDNEAVRDALGLGGILLCVLGLLYGGFWRIQMRRRFGLPANDACCGKPDLTDCLQWLCCYSCSLAQEVRTADAYEVVHDRLYRHRSDDNDSSTSSSQPQMQQHPTLQDELSTMQQSLRFAGVFSTSPSAASSSPVSDDISFIQQHTRAGCFLVLPDFPTCVAEFIAAQAGHMVATLHKFNHVFAFDTLAPQPLLCKVLQLCIFWTRVGIAPFVLIASHPIMPLDLTTYAERASAFDTLSQRGSIRNYFEQDSCIGWITSLKDINQG